MSAGRITVDHLSIELGEGSARFEVLRDLFVTIAPGEFVCLLGPSGCGKSTLLGALAGHLAPSRGRLALDGESITGPAPDRGLVFQQHTLFPWKTAIENVGHGLKMKGVPRAERNRRALELLELVGLKRFEHRYPRELSGGMQQRVEIARVLINHPRVLLMDEPFGALDALTRSRMQELLLDLWARMRTTVVFVTHDIDEALFLADRVLVIGPRPGRIVEEITLDFARPRSAALLTEPAFVQLKRRCLSLLREDAGAQALERLTPLGTPRWRFAT
ncbi:ABC transporter ATP-binding protein [Pelomonas aquatica]|jgi:NitT/TauT family transport system ATP-binding protein|uniref:ABC transporter ATP-binding protein n=1 Tax=Pelomonas aquatica TaxID=431058 RepID=A0A9X4LQG7_9BURK|nr:ABC transporter ATP-binding protein [Pelomonas aquatica]MCY4756401.1 ABC transporter ATP-binding protein [Pelomonas aquatica]MDG0864623.1 ABC transporter ATP-binding protein [Pelomonas aquatica]